jgi:hypothetical protein
MLLSVDFKTLTKLHRDSEKRVTRFCFQHDFDVNMLVGGIPQDFSFTRLPTQGMCHGSHNG